MINKLYFSWCFTLTILCFFSQASISLSSFMPGLIIMWFLFFVFLLGSASRFRFTSHPIIKEKKKIWFLFLPLSLFFVVQYIKFYTGNGFSDVLAPRNAYIEYQRYFSKHSLNQFSFVKLPYILGFFLIKFAFIYINIKLVIFKERLKVSDYFYFFFSSLFLIYTSLGRGTSFELFELVCFVFFVIYARFYFSGRKLLLNFKALCLFVLLPVLGFCYFGYNLNKRYGNELLELDFNGYCSTANYCLDSSTLLFESSIITSVVLFKLASYFCHGLFILSTFLQLVLSDFQLFISFLLPNKGGLIGVNQSYEEIVCLSIDCGVTWIPEFLKIIQYLGFPLSCFFVFCLGKFSRYLIKSKITVLKLILVFYILLFLISLCTGSFVSISSSTKLIIVSTLSLNLLQLYLRSQLGRQRNLLTLK